MKLSLAEPYFLEKTLLPKNGPKTGFFNLLRNLVILLNLF